MKILRERTVECHEVLLGIGLGCLQTSEVGRWRLPIFPKPGRGQ